MPWYIFCQTFKSLVYSPENLKIFSPNNCNSYTIPNTTVFMKMTGPNIPGLKKAEPKHTEQQCHLIWQAVTEHLLRVSFYAIHFTRVVSFNHPTPSSSVYHPFSLTNEQAGRPGKLKGFPKARCSCKAWSTEPRLESKVDALPCCSLCKNLMCGSHHVGHKGESASYPCPQEDQWAR